MGVKEVVVGFLLVSVKVLINSEVSTGAIHFHLVGNQLFVPIRPSRQYLRDFQWIRSCSLRRECRLL